MAAAEIYNIGDRVVLASFTLEMTMGMGSHWEWESHWNGTIIESIVRTGMGI